MKYLVKAQLYALTALFALASFAFAQSVVARPSQLPTGAYINGSDGDHYFVQTVEVVPDKAVALVDGDDIVISLPTEIDVADIDINGNKSEEIYIIHDQAAGALPVVAAPVYAAGPPATITITLTTVNGFAVADYIAVIFPVTTTGTPTTGLTYGVTGTAMATAPTSNLVSLVSTVDLVTFDGTNLEELGDGSVTANIRGKFHPNSSVASNFTTGGLVSIIDENPAGGTIFGSVPAVNDWLPTSAAIGDNDGDTFPDDDGEVLFYLYATPESGLDRVGLSSDARLIGDISTRTVFTGFDASAELNGLADLSPLDEGVWYFYITSSASADWVFASSDSLVVTHYPALVHMNTDIVVDGGQGAGVDYSYDQVYDPLIADDTPELWLESGGVLDKDGDIVDAKVNRQTVDIFWFVDDVDDNARIQVFISENDTITAASAVLNSVTGTVTSLYDATEVTPTAQYEDDQDNFVTFNIESDGVYQAAGSYTVYIVLNDSNNVTVEAIKQAGGGAFVLELAHYPFLQFHDNRTADATLNTGENQYYTISWGETKDGDKDPDASPGATITIYAVDRNAETWATIISPPGGTAINPAKSLVTVVTEGNGYLLTTMVDDADNQYDNRYDWDARNEGVNEGIYDIWATIEDGTDMLTRQYNSDVADFTPVSTEDRGIVIEHGNYFMANSPFEGETVELSNDDIYQFTWADASASSAAQGLVKILLAPDGSDDLSDFDYRALSGTVGWPKFTDAGVAGTYINDVGTAGTYTGNEPAVIRVVMDAAATFEWYLDGIFQAAGVAVGNPTAIAGVDVYHPAAGGYDPGDYWEVDVFPPAAGGFRDNYYWVVGGDGSAPLGVAVGYDASLSLAELEVVDLTTDYEGNVTSIGAAATTTFDAYYFYAQESDFTTGYSAETFTGTGTNDMTVTANIGYDGPQTTTYRVVISVAVGAGPSPPPDEYEVYRLPNTTTPIIASTGMPAAGTAFPIERGVYAEFATDVAHTLGDYWEFTAYAAKEASKADGQVYFNNASGGAVNFRVTPTSITAEMGDTLTFTLQGTYTAAANVRMVEAYLDVPSAYLEVLGDADSVIAAPGTFFGGTVMKNGVILNVDQYEIDYQEITIPAGKDFNAAWEDLGTFRVVVKDYYSGDGLSHNLIKFSQSTGRLIGMYDVNLDPYAVVSNTNAADVQLYRRGSLQVAVEIEGRTEENEAVAIHVAPSGAFTTISDSRFMTNNSIADVDLGIPAVLNAGGTFSVVDVPTGVYDVYVIKNGWLRQKVNGLKVQPTSVTQATFQNSDKLLGGDVAGYVDENDNSVPDNKVDVEDVDAVVATIKGTVINPYADLDDDGEVGLADLVITVKNSGTSGEGFVFDKAIPEVDGTNAKTTTYLKLIAEHGDEYTYVVAASDLVSLRGYQVNLELNTDQWELVSINDGLARYDKSTSFHLVEGFETRIYGASAKWEGLYESEMDLVTITLRSLALDREEPSISEVSLVDVDFALTKAIIDANGGLPSEFELSQNYPNPFNPTTSINFALPEAGKVRLAVYNLLGQEVRSLVSGTMDAGSYKAVWNSMDNTGRKVSSGVYFYRLMVDGKIINTRKMLLLK